MLRRGRVDLLQVLARLRHGKEPFDLVGAPRHGALMGDCPAVLELPSDPDVKGPAQPRISDGSRSAGNGTS